MARPRFCRAGSSALRPHSLPIPKLSWCPKHQNKFGPGARSARA